MSKQNKKIDWNAVINETLNEVEINSKFKVTVDKNQSTEESREYEIEIDMSKISLKDVLDYAKKSIVIDLQRDIRENGFRDGKVIKLQVEKTVRKGRKTMTAQSMEKTFGDMTPEQQVAFIARLEKIQN